MKIIRSMRPQKAFGEGVTHFCLNNVPDSCEAAVEAAREMGISSMVFSTFIEGESRRQDTSLPPWQGRYRLITDRLRRPVLYSVQGDHDESGGRMRGTGGPSHELALGFAHGARYTEAQPLHRWIQRAQMGQPGMREH